MNDKFQRLKDYKEKFGLVWSNPKSHAMIMLSFWFIVVLFFSVLVRFNNNKVEKLPSVVEPTSAIVKNKLNLINSYEEDILVLSDIVHLTHFNNNDLIIYNGERYIYSDDLYSLETNEIVDNTLLKDLAYYNIQNIAEWISNVEEDYMTVYSDNSFVISYTVENLIITISGKDNIENIDLYLRDSYISNIKINLLNINNIEDLKVVK